MGSPVPPRYERYATEAAAALGVPLNVVAAQIQLESDWDSRAVSPAGAEGIAQFEPGTWATWAPPGASPFDPAASFVAYTRFMGELLKWSHGNVRKALAAYNAGQGNWTAGLGYADTILSRAGAAPTLTAVPGSGSTETTIHPPSSSGGGGLLSWPGQILGFFDSATRDVSKTVAFAGAFFQPSTYIRIGAGIGGVVFLVFGLVCLGLAARER